MLASTFGQVGCRPIASVVCLLLLQLQPSAISTPSLTPRTSRLHEQWQPQTEHDPRLQQPVHIEIVGRSAAAAMKLLSDQTGVSLGVDPENLDTIGERKLTIIAQGCSLKALMVQSVNALQECHFDIDTTGPQPAYLLHRNGSMDAAIAELSAADEAAYREQARPARQARIADARRALLMSPRELAELDQTDPLLAATMRDPLARGRVEGFLSLPEENIAQFAENGETTLDYASAPDSLRVSVRDDLQALLEREKARAGTPDTWLSAIQTMSERISEVSLVYRQVVPGDPPEVVDLRISFGMDAGTMNLDVLVIPPRLPQDRRSLQLRELLRRTGAPDGRSADAFIDDLWEQSSAQRTERAERRHARLWRAPHSAELQREIVLPFKGDVDPVEVQKFIAKETGFSVISDYFTTWDGPQPIPDEAKGKLPVWQLLYILGERWLWSYEWNETGNCLVFRNRNWYRLVARELPESLVCAYTAKLEEQGGFTLEEVADLAAAVASRRDRLFPTEQKLCPSMPPELDRAGLGWGALACDAVVLYAKLTPEQRIQARTRAGLPYQDMTREQKALVRQSCRSSGRAEDASQAVYYVSGPTHVRDWLRLGPRDLWRLRIVLPGRTVGTQVRIRPPQPSTPPHTPSPSRPSAPGTRSQSR
jgi:hypothetical protein